MEERGWRYLSVMPYRMELGCATVPWAEPDSRFTLHFKAFAVAVIGACRSLSQAASLLGLH
jgi:hypothetical protein